MLGRTLRYVREQFAFLLVLLVLIVSLVYLTFATGRWGRTAGGVAVAVLLAGVFRAVLPDGRVGMLAVRGRIVDSISFLALGALILVVDIRLHA